MPYSKEFVQKAIALRLKGRLSLDAISKRLHISKATASYWLRPYPLTEKEKYERAVRSGVNSKGHIQPKTKEYFNRPESKFYKVIKKLKYNTSELATIAEAAVAYRLTVFGFSVFYSISDGHCIDWVVFNKKANKFLKIQVKTLKYGKMGLPNIPVLRCKGRHREKLSYSDRDLDFIVGYDFKKDIAFVLSYSEIKGKSSVAISKESEEAWNKLLV